MANALYDAGRNAFANGNIDWVNDDIRCILIDTADYTVDLAVDDNLDDIPGAAREEVMGASMAGKSCPDSDGACDANDVTFASASGDPCEALVIYKHTGVESTSTLIAYIDTATGLPVTLNGGDVVVSWQATTPYIFKL